MPVINHYNIRRVLDVYGSTQGRDLGAVGRDIQKIVDANKKNLPRGSFIRVRGQIETMKLVLLRPHRRSRLRHRSGLPAHRGQLPVLARSLHHHHGSPGGARRASCSSSSSRGPRSASPALMGAIMCMGVATANSILVVSFREGAPPAPRRRRAGRARSRCHPLPPRHHDGPWQ